MKQITLELLFHLFGISAASGLVYDNTQIHLISDDSSYLYHYNMHTEKISETPLAEDGIGLEKITKSDKPDFESITTDGVNYFVFGSGSTEKRIDLIEVSKITNEVISVHKLDILYESMKSFANLNDADFNIEGVIFDNDTWYFFNRGNGPKKQNGIFVVTGDNILNDFRITYTPISLPKLDKVQTSFTDAVKVDDKIYFLAAAENTDSAFDDGEVNGTLVGRINPKKMKVEKTKIISKDKKFEGITLFKKDQAFLEFLICDDADNPSENSAVYKLRFKK